jgi:NADPH-dependent ferric siderophore reductase
VLTIEALSDHMLRIAFGGEGLAPFSWPGPASHLKLFLPEAGRREVELPPADAEGFMVIDPGTPRPTTRTFTPRSWDGARLEIDFVLHGHGPASEWAGAARPGDRAAVSQPRSTCEVLPDSRWLLLAGDEAALPALATLLEAIDPGPQVQLLVEIQGPDHRVALPDHGAPVRWLVRESDETPGDALLAAIAGWTSPAGPGQVFAACEAAAVRAIRAHLLGPREMPKQRVLTRGYWRLGEANHPDHDFGEDAA